MSSNVPPEIEDKLDEEQREYVELLHDRVQSLTEELEEAEERLLQLERNGVATSADDEAVVIDRSDDTGMARLVRYAEFLDEFEEDEEVVSQVRTEVVRLFDDYVDSTQELHEASIALVAFLLKHEEIGG